MMRRYSLSVLISLLVMACDAIYHWDYVYNSNDYLSDTVYHSSNSEGTQAVCRVDNWASGRDSLYYGVCYIPSGNTEHRLEKPYEVLIRDPLYESMQWVTTTSVSQIRANAVVVCKNCNPEPEMYVCATQNWGPGKLVVWADNDVICYVSHKWDEHRFTSGYQVLMAMPAYEYRITDINYYLDTLDVLRDSPLTMATATFINRDKNEQLIIQTLTYGKSSENVWETGVGLVIGASMTVSAGIPLFVEAEWEIGAETSYDYSYGQTHTESITVSLEAQVTVPPESSCMVTITAREMVVDVPYDATVTVYHADGTTRVDYITGIYEGLSVSQDTVEIRECLPLSLDVLNYDK